MTIINIRGTSGSGKSTLVKKIMTHYKNVYPGWVYKRMRPHYYTLSNPPPVEGGWSLDPLAVLGHYEIPTGGCDPMPNLDLVYQLVDRFNANKLHVLYEGLLASEDVKRAVACAHTPNVMGDFHVILLNTPVDLCIDRVKGRRAEAGNEKPFNEKNTRDRVATIIRACNRLVDSGIKVERLDCDAAYERVKELLNL